MNTKPDDDPRDVRGTASGAASAAELVARELAALGEEPASADELSVLRPRSAQDDAVSLARDPETVVSVATVFDIGHRTPGAPLDELAARRVWRSVEGRLGAAAAQEPSPSPSASPAVFRTVVAGLAVAASLVVLPRLALEGDLDPQDRKAQREALETLGDSARAGLDRLPGERGAVRADALADAYAQRLAAQEGRDGGER